MTRELLDTLKKCLKAKGITYRQLARALRLSEPSMKRLFSSGRFTLGRLEEVLRVLELDFYELARLARSRGSRRDELSLEQETALAQDPRLLAVFWLVASDWKFEEIVEEFTLGRAQLQQFYERLARLQLIDWRPGERTRLRVAKDYVWRQWGPVKKAYGRQVTQEFLAAHFDAPLEVFRFETRELSGESAAVIKRKLERLAAEISELAQIDSALPVRKRVGLGVLLACRPWTFSVLHALKVRR